MNTHVRDLKRGDCLSPTAPQLLGNPLDFIHEDHLRERTICAQMDGLAGARTPDEEAAARVLGFLKKELPLHLEDEEEDLFPLLRRRCAREDEIGKVIDRLTSDHGHAGEDAPRVIVDLEALQAGQSDLTRDMRERLARFAAHARRHLVLENAIILPFARMRLTERDLETLRLRMMQRRGLDRSMEAPDAERPD
ncbi:hemerythrin domain-containing protein [Rhodosalinus sp. K401]|uniref:hemerythrin domain-containing protein n=1 Tax=Rhodosalinus sp. K401 TaxID=3239195 RepID=UPI00352357C0